MIATILKVLKVIWKILTYLLKGIMLVGTYVAYPFVFCTGERRFLPFQTYRVSMKDPLALALYKGLLYMGWGSISFFYFRYLWFTYTCVTIFCHDILGYERNTEHLVLLVIITVFLGGLYFFLIFTQSRQTDLRRSIGMVSIISILGRIGLLSVWISVLVISIFIQEELIKGEELKDIVLTEKVLIKTDAKEELLDTRIELVERWEILEQYYASFYLKKEYKDLVFRYVLMFFMAFLIKILLLHLDIYYIGKKEYELKRVI